MGVGVVLFQVLGHSVTLFWAFVCFIWLIYAWETYLDYRQRRTIQKTSSPPVELSDLITEEEFLKSKAYALDKSSFSFVHDAYDTAVVTVILCYHLVPWLWDKVMMDIVSINASIKSASGVDLGWNSDSEIICSLLFLLYVSIFKFFESMPWSLYYNFVIEARHGFNNQTLAFFMKDRIKAFVISTLIGFPIAATLIWIIKIGGRHFYVFAYLFALVVTVFMMFVYPEYIAPLFDRYERLPDGDLRQKIEALAARIDFPLKKLLVVEGSKRSAHSNAYFYGFGKNKRIVLFDTLIKDFKFPGKDGNTPGSACNQDDKAASRGCAVDEEIVAVLGHELGHWKRGHTIINLLIGQANLLLMFVVFSSLMNIDSIFASFGFTSTVPILLRLVVIFQFIFSPYNTVLAFLMTVLSRRLEFQADEFAVNLGYGSFLKAALLVLHKDNLSFPVSDWLYSMCNYSHPPILERLAAIDSLLRKAQ
ncbi:hypothetical protein AHF37_10751 [Paragonimus kellicotti]|nr:hypothetical protein AHF37_10751 [Paragonimus kellicotti]